MVKSIEFTLKSGFLNDIKYKTVLRKGKTLEDYQKEIDEYFKNRSSHGRGDDIYEKFFREVKDGYKNELARKCLGNRKIEFEKDRINLIYGPNASGKSTILKSIAGYAMCGNAIQFDGWTNILKYDPSDINANFFNHSESKYSQEKLLKRIMTDIKNSVNIEWDGNPVYFHNFENRVQTGSCDDFEGTILGSFRDAMKHYINSKSMNSAKNQYYILDRLFDLAKSDLNTESLIEEAKSKVDRANDIWQKAYQCQIDYVQSLYKEKTCRTFLLDEIDKTLDIFNVTNLFKNELPELQKINGDQIIVISHNPLVLSEAICDTKIYNIISLHPEYTENVRELFRKAF